MKTNLQNIAIVLVGPKYPENIGSVARCAMNMGIPRLIAVNPVNADREKMLKMATHEAAGLIGAMEVYDSISRALAGFQYIAGTTSRLGRHRRAQMTPRELAVNLVGLSQQNRVAILFGPENSGLSNDELKYCHATVTIPTADFASINLSQAVMIVIYEIFVACNPELGKGSEISRLASLEELEGMYTDLREVLDRIGFLKPGGEEHAFEQLRTFLCRVRLLSRDTQMIRGICRQFRWFSRP